MTRAERLRRLNRDPAFRKAHRDGQRRRWGLDKLTDEQLETYFELKAKLQLPVAEIMQIVRG